MPKSIPTLGLANWGQPLNEHLSQLNDTTNGGINTSTFATRPTTLTANDIGYTTINKDTGNFHQWNGTAWEVLKKQGVINARDFGGYTADAIQKAIDSIDNNTTSSNDGYQVYLTERVKGNIIFLDAGEWIIDKPIKLRGLIQIVGVGFATVLRPTATLGDNYMMYTAENSGAYNEITLSNFSVYDVDPTISRTKYHFNLCNTINLKISHIWFDVNGRTLTDVGGFNIYQDGTQLVYLARITDCLISGGSIVMAITDSWIMRCSIFAQGRSFAIHLKTASQIIEHCEMDGSAINGCIYIDAGVGATVAGIQIRNNYLDGGYSTTDSGMPIKCVSNLDSSMITNNWIYNFMDGAMTIANPTNVVINGNVFDGCNRRDTGQHEIAITGALGPKNCVITSNTFSRKRNPQTNKGYVIHAPGPYSAASQNIIAHNTVNGIDYLPNGILVADYVNFSIQANKGLTPNFPEYESTAGFQATGTGTNPGKVFMHSTDGNSGARDIGYLNFSSNVLASIAQIKARTNGSFDDDGQLLFYTSQSTLGAQQRMIIDGLGRVGINKTNPNSKLSVDGLVEYTDNATALAAGLTAGDFYRTGDILKVVH
jgi:hypothetical protein